MARIHGVDARVSIGVHLLDGFHCGDRVEFRAAVGDLMRSPALNELILRWIAARSLMEDTRVPILQIRLQHLVEV